MEGRFLYFKKFRLDVRSGELVKEGRPVRLPPQPTKLLLLLVRSPGALVSHEEIQKELWGEDTFVDFEQAIKKCVKQVRAALEDDAEEPLYVETVPRRGYRFMGPLRVDGGEISPYPGLSTFSEKDARFFFGREGEAEALWNKIARRRLLALKASFARSPFLQTVAGSLRRERTERSAFGPFPTCRRLLRTCALTRTFWLGFVPGPACVSCATRNRSRAGSSRSVLFRVGQASCVVTRTVA